MIAPCPFPGGPTLSQEIRSFAQARAETMADALRRLVSTGAHARPALPPGTLPAIGQEASAALAALRGRLAPELATAPHWDGLRARLRAIGYDLRICGTRLTVFGHPSGCRICDAGDLGGAFMATALRLGTP